jgi:lysozyme family protein
MTASSYDEALERVLVHEGGYSNHPDDPGGPTNYGITIDDYRHWVKPDATADDVRKMPLADAKAIYRKRYWDAMRCDGLPAGLDYATFDYGVNSGIGRSGRVLRRLLALDENGGAVSDELIAAVRGHDAAELIRAICDERLAFLRQLRTWDVFGRGWSRRVAEVRAAALAMAERATTEKATQELATGPDLPTRIIATMRRLGYPIADKSDELNIAYVEGMDPDGRPNGNAPNEFNDLRCVIRIVGGKAVMAGCWDGTTEPSRYWTEHPMQPGGAARIAFGQYAAWTVGMHRGDHEALLQVEPVTICRDANEDYKRDGDRTDTGLYGINQHWGYDLPRNDLGRSSAGCLVGRTRDGHRTFMTLVKSDARYRADPQGFRFPTAILPAAEVLAAVGASLEPAPTGREGAPKAPPAVLGAGVGAALGVAAHWLGAHPAIAIGIASVTMLLVVLIHRFIKE